MIMPRLPEEAVFNVARQIGAADARAAYLSQICGDDADLLARVQALLRIYDEERSFLESPAVRPEDTVDEQPAEAAGAVIGPYKLLEQIGEGGFGVVFLAEQTQPIRRKVALKILKPGMDTKQVVARFQAERQALALMDHPNIARVYDGGATASGRPYFIMELVRGVPITDFCDQEHLTVAERLELFVHVCQAVQHAHQKGVIHRDLKPSNILVTMHDCTPVVKIIDFGIAKATGQQLTEKTLFTNLAQMVGTPLYMSPEQAALGSLDVDTRSDVYSLGVLLYELLTGATPFDRARLKTAGYDEIRRIIREEEPVRPSTRLSTSGPSGVTASENRKSEPQQLSRLFRGELDWIVMKALEKDRNRRYESASAFAADVQRFLHDEPVQACPPSGWYRLRKFARRNKGALLTAAVVVLALITGTVVSTGQAIRAIQAETLAEQRLEAETQARRQALANLKRARAGVDQMLTQVAEERLYYVPQMEEVRRDLLRGALAFYQELLDENGDDVALRQERALAQGRLGKVHEHLGHYAEAYRALRQATAALAEPAPGCPLCPEARAALADFYTYLGWSCTYLRRPAEAIAAQRQALAAAEALAAEFPEDSRFRRQLVAACLNLGAAISNRQRGEAESLYRRAIALAGTDVEGRHQLATSHVYLGGIFAATRRQVEAGAAYEQALRVAEQLHVDLPNRRQVWTLLGNALLQQGGWLSAHGSAQAAETGLRRALGFYDKLSFDFPNVPGYRAAQAKCLSALGGLLHRQRRYPEAEATYRRALGLYEKLAADFPTLSTYLEPLPQHQMLLAQVLLRTGQTQEASEALGQAAANHERLAADFPTRLLFRIEFGSRVSDLAATLAAEGRTADADAAFAKATGIADQLDAEFGADAEHHIRLAQHRVTLGLSYQKAGRYAEAEKTFRDALTRFTRLADASPHDAEPRQGVVSCHIRLGVLFTDAGHPQDAVEPYRHALALSKKLAEDFPADEAYTENWAGNYFRLGRLLASLDRCREATEQYRLAVPLYARLAAASESRQAAFRYAQASTLNNIAWLLATCADPAARNAAQAIELAKQATELVPKARGFWNTRGAAHYRAGDWKAALAAFEQSMELCKGGDAFDWFFMAMAHAQSGRAEEANRWYAKAVQWMEKNDPKNGELVRFRAEAAGLLKKAKRPE